MIGTLGLVLAVAFGIGCLVGLLIKCKAGGLSFWYRVFCDSRGKPSLTRVVVAFIVAFGMSWISIAVFGYLLWGKPVDDLVKLISSLGLFFGIMLGIFWIPEKSNEVAKTIKGSPDKPAPPEGENK